ncbi:C40 family peptidase [bacterium]|nr:C40 family peptidase [bacterium]MBU1957348.1 C40 family peptidase [bacterium]
MRTIKRVSLALLTTPILFTGCMQEKVSTIIPPKSTDNQIVLNSTEKSQTVVANKGIFNDANHTFGSKTETNQPVTNNILDQLALDVQNNMDVEITGNSALVSTALEIGNNWEVNSKENEILETAKEFLGVKYIWAANGPTAFDCSGYTRYVFKQNGITLPRYSGNQAKIGTKVKFNELEKGDLVFFDTAKRSTGKVNHVGIFIGNNKFIHASSGGKKVMITSFNKKKFYKNRFLHGQRVVNSNESFAALHSTNNMHI